MDDSTVIRVTHRRHYTVISNDLAQNRRLTWEARGMMLYLLSKPDDWELKPPDLEQCCGRDKVYHILNELIKARYIVRDNLKDAKHQHAGVAYRVYEEPLPEKPDTASPDTGNTDSTKYRESPSTDSSANADAKGYFPFWNAIADSFYDGVRKGNSKIARILYGVFVGPKTDRRVVCPGLIARECERQRLPEDRLDYKALAAMVSHFKAAFQNGQALELRDPEKFILRWEGWRNTAGASGGAVALAAPRLTYDPDCPLGCSYGLLIMPDGKARTCDCRKRILAEMEMGK